ncbi:helix-turn-helix domain-containing protein [Paenibacillus sp. LMG 31461]|uniref:Helix-turn-helix domain-containing protein n=1 Tax=Paenibacillus plantarum TaxID=2654975 RepID=A0ABX1X656_9BACL|nr:AraC family transcriptional regulator [Paenibacillus plantarum]NOU63907.1 helix-turn-helix domain-containing protein [Paenibacillus plantarum]
MKGTDLFNDLSEHVSLRITSYNTILHNAGWVESKSHHNYDLWLIQEGQVEIQAGKTIHTATAGDLVLFYPGIPYTAMNGTQACRFIYLHFDFGLGEQQRILESFPLSGVVAGCLIEEEADGLRKIFQENLQAVGMSGMRLKGSLMILIARILECYGAGTYKGGFLNDSVRSEHAGNLVFLQPTILYIQENLHRPIRITELAEVAGMSEKYFIRYFKQALGVTPGQYMIQLRMNRARDLVYTQRYSMQQVAALLGYPDAYSFSKAFKKHYKVPPSKFV